MKMLCVVVMVGIVLGQPEGKYAIGGPHIIVPDNLHIKGSIEGYPDLAIELFYSLDLFKAKVHIFTELFDFEDFLNYDGAQDIVIFKAASQCRHIQGLLRGKDVDTIQMMMRLGLGMFNQHSEYKGLEEEKHIFRFPSHDPRKQEFYLYFDSELNLEKIRVNFVNNEVTFDIDIFEPVDSEVFTPIEGEPENCPYLLEAEAKSLPFMAVLFGINAVPDDLLYRYPLLIQELRWPNFKASHKLNLIPPKFRLEVQLAGYPEIGATIKASLPDFEGSLSIYNQDLNLKDFIYINLNSNSIYFKLGKLCRTIDTSSVEEIAREIRMIGDLTEFLNKWEIFFDQVPSEDKNTFVYRFPKFDPYDSYTPHDRVIIDLKFKEELIDQAIFTFKKRDWDIGIDFEVGKFAIQAIDPFSPIEDDDEFAYEKPERCADLNTDEIRAMERAFEGMFISFLPRDFLKKFTSRKIVRILERKFSL
jgi:hypothetical protein